MRNRFWQKAMNLLLSGLVLAWGIMPLGVQHAHAGGSDPSHKHGERDEIAHDDSHDHELDDEHHDHSIVSDLSLLADNVLHLHWSLLGVELSMPLPEEPVESGDDGDTVPPTVVRVMNDVVPATQAGPSSCRALLVAICTPSTDVVWALTPAPRSPNLVTSIPLCDSARLERSGVLLA